MLFAVLFTDIANSGELRTQFLQAHIEWLEMNKEIILIGGSLRLDLGETPKGGLWIARANSKEQLDKIIKTDPFYIAGLRQSYEILYWSKSNSQRKELI